MGVYIQEKNPYISILALLHFQPIFNQINDRTPLIIDFYCSFGSLYSLITEN